MSLAISKTTFPKVAQQNRGLRPVAPFLHQTSQKRNPSQEREGFLPAALCFATFFPLLPLDGYSFAAPSFQLRLVFGAVSSRVPSGDAMSRFVDFGDKSWDNSKNFFQTQGFEFLFLSQRARRDAFASSISPKTPVLKLNRPFARKPSAAIASESTRAAFMLVEKPQVAALRRPRVK